MTKLLVNRLSTHVEEMGGLPSNTTTYNILDYGGALRKFLPTGKFIGF